MVRHFQKAYLKTVDMYRNLVVLLFRDGQGAPWRRRAPGGRWVWSLGRELQDPEDFVGRRGRAVSSKIGSEATGDVYFPITE